MLIMLETSCLLVPKDNKKKNKTWRVEVDLKNNLCDTYCPPAKYSSLKT